MYLEELDSSADNFNMILGGEARMIAQPLMAKLRLQNGTGHGKETV